ncbi:hypothetical protein CISG_04460 [Coccidioides immitis RMSCC 3703]|uniref:Uncharacterized protein n=2 Tax=Coccidioides immitis TaxID=5501 RepID=A0A0J8QPK1_COCIT|nr:hypothetical protein CIRG_05337 [Coccidioides immitis RMSCC 2394]KMU74386.1 hypothetical protein CISG_04460 [Coccidioides immitis RMSCC 3703]
MDKAWKEGRRKDTPTASSRRKEARSGFTGSEGCSSRYRRPTVAGSMGCLEAVRAAGGRLACAGGWANGAALLFTLRSTLYYRGNPALPPWQNQPRAKIAGAHAEHCMH